MEAGMNSKLKVSREYSHLEQRIPTTSEPLPNLIQNQPVDYPKSKIQQHLTTSQSDPEPTSRLPKDKKSNSKRTKKAKS